MDDEVKAALARVERALAKDRTLDDYPDYQAVRLIVRALGEARARQAHHDEHVAALRATVLQATGWVHAYNDGDAAPGEASLYLDSMPNDLLPNEHFGAKRLAAVRALSLEPLLALGVTEREDLDRAWDLLMNQDPSVAGGVLLRLEPVAVSILFRLALDANARTADGSWSPTSWPTKRSGSRTSATLTPSR